MMTVGAILLLLCAMPACASNPAQEPTDGSPVLLTASGAVEASREAAITGVLEIRDGCFVVSGDEGDWLVEWPHGTTLGENGESVNVPDFGTIRVGDRLDAGGGYEADHARCDASGVQGTASIDLLQ